MTQEAGNQSLTVLIVEDMEGPAETLKATITEALQEVEILVEDDFGEALKYLRPTNSPEAMVLDLYLGNPEHDHNLAGQLVWERIWQEKLIPVVIHTGGDAALNPPVPDDNPFVKCVPKGTGSDVIVANHLRSMTPYILALRQVGFEFNRAINSVLTRTTPGIWKATSSNPEIRPEVLTRAARRQLAAQMDSKVLTFPGKFLAWEQYIYPPVEESLLTADILRLREGDEDDPSAYRLVLTPSCDLQINQGKCKVDAVLVAKCTDMGAYLKAATLAPNKLGERLPRLLTEPHNAGYVPLPEFTSIVPCMAADLRALDLIAITDIDSGSSGERMYTRIASVDSPFRELIVWAYLQISGRPGVPDRDLDKWVNDIGAAVSREKKPGDQK